MIKTRLDYEQQMLGDVVSNQTGTLKVTKFRIGGVVRAIITAVAGVLADLTNDILQFKRSAFLDTATDDQVPAIAKDRGISGPNPASASSVIVVFSGPDGTVIPAGTQIQTAGLAATITFQTLVEITLNASNAGIPGLISVGFGNAALCASTITGAATKVPAGTVTVISPAIAGVTCTNPLPAWGGTDQEDPANFRERIRNYVNILAQGTQAFYEATAQLFDSTVLRAYAEYDPIVNGTKLSLLKNTGAGFDSTTLTNAATFISGKQRATEPVSCVNVTMTGLSISCDVQLEPGIEVADGYANIANALSDFIDWTQWAFGETVRYSDIADVVNNAVGVAYIDLSTLLVNSGMQDLSIAASSLPRLVALSITTIDTAETVSYAPTQTRGGIIKRALIAL